LTIGDDHLHHHNISITSNDIADDIIIVIQHVELFKACDTPGPNSTNYLCWNTPRRWQGCGVSTFNELQMMCNVLGYLIHLYTTDFLSPQSRSVYTHLLCVSKKYPSDGRFFDFFAKLKFVFWILNKSLA